MIALGKIGHCAYDEQMAACVRNQSESSDLRRKLRSSPLLWLLAAQILSGCRVGVPKRHNPSSTASPQVLSLSSASAFQVSATPATSSCANESLRGSHHTYDIGPGRKYTEVSEVPWLSLTAGDVVNIYYRAEPYRTKLGLRAQGTRENPVVINGVTNEKCERPMLTGEDSVPSRDAAEGKYFSEKYTEFLGTIIIYRGPGDPWGYKPKHIQIKNLKITGASKGAPYTAQSGAKARFGQGAGGIYAVVVEDLLVENCEITGNGNGVFVNTRNDSEEEASRRVTLRRNILHLNGTPGSYYEHNAYVQAERALYEGNYIGQLVDGALGSSLKDRSSGTIVRFNHIDAAARAIDLVETEGGATTVFRDPNYHSAWVYGNLIISDWGSRERTSSELLIHWGGDNSPQFFRRGTLFFYYNTVVTHGERREHWRINVFDMPTNDQHVEARSNVFYHSGDTNLQLLVSAGSLTFLGTNWISKGWQRCREDAKVTINFQGKLMEGASPGFRAPEDRDFTLTADAAIVDAGDREAPTNLLGHWVDFEYQPIARLIPRTRQGQAYDLGAFER